MGFVAGRRFGRHWDDAIELDRVIQDHQFNTTGKDEKHFESGFAHSLNSFRERFTSNVITQMHKSTTVRSIYCFGKNHRPDMTLDEHGIAIELKFITYAGLKNAIGQGYLYRLRYRFVFLILIISESRKSIYSDIARGKERDMEDTLQHLADKMNIFTYIVPAFNIKQPGTPKCFSYFGPADKLG